MTPLPPSIFHFFILLTTLTTAEALIRNLSGAASFRSAVIRWENQREKSSGPAEAASEPIFAISICETQPWGPRECRETITDAKRLHKTQDDGIGGRHEAFAYELKGLRMATKYTVSVREVVGDVDMEMDSSRSSRQTEKNHNNVRQGITLATKGFSARATSCNATTTQILLETGPGFSGRISLEKDNSADERDSNRTADCSVVGEGKASNRSTVLFSIDHAKCAGVRVNASSVRAFVLVQESLPILTHSTRRFLVVCHFKPGTFTVQAGLNMPASELKRISDVLSFRSTKINNGANEVTQNVPPNRPQPLKEEPRSLSTANQNRDYFRNWDLFPRRKRKIAHQSQDQFQRRFQQIEKDLEMKLLTSTRHPNEEDFVTTTMPIISLDERKTEKDEDRKVPTTTTLDFFPAVETTTESIGDLFERSNTIDSHEWYPSGSFYKVEKSTNEEERSSKSFAFRQPREKLMEDMEEYEPKELASDFPISVKFHSDKRSQEWAEKKKKRTKKFKTDDEEGEIPTSSTASETLWFTIEDDYQHPTSHIVVMIVLVICAIVGSAATIHWIYNNCKHNKIGRRRKILITSTPDSTISESSSQSSESEISNVHNNNSNDDDDGNHQDSAEEVLYENLKPGEINSPSNQQPKSLDPNIESFA